MLEPARAHEAATFAALLAEARARQQAATAPSRILLEAARSMAQHVGLSDARMQASLAPMALWQLYLQAALGRRHWDFDAVRTALPWSYARLRTALLPLRTRAQVAHAGFHMAAFPLVDALLGAVWRDLHDGPLHLLVGSRNLAWFQLPGNRWVGASVEVIANDGPGLRRLLAGLKQGTIRRLLVLADGPQAPGAPGTRALAGLSATLGMRTTLLARLHALGIPLVPITHEWDAQGLVVTPHAPLEPAALDEDAYVTAVALHIEDLLRRHPEQWLNWNAARIRT